MNLSNYLSRLAILTALIIIFNESNVQAEDKAYGEILYICAYNSDTPFANEIMDEMLRDYNNFGGSYPIATEAMNCHSLLIKSEWMSTLRQILSSHPFAKAVVLYGTEAWACYLSLTEEKYKKLPVICLASQRYAASIPNAGVPLIENENKDNDGVIDYLEEMKSFNVKACYYYDYGIDRDIELMLKLFPNTQNVAVISDNSFSGASMFNLSIKYLRQNKSNLTIIPINGQEITMEEASELISDLPHNTAAIFCMWRYDKNGTIHTSYSREMFKLYTEAQKIPVFTLSGSTFGKWPLAGFFPTFDWKDGRKMPAEILYSILDRNENPKPYFFQVPNQYRIDKRTADLFNISKDKYPEGSIIVNDDLQIIRLFWEEYKIGIIIISLLSLTGLIMAVVLLIYIKRIKKAQTELAAVNEQLKRERREWLDFHKKK